MIKKKVLVIIPDRFVKATGGMGTFSAFVFEKLSLKYDFYVVGFPLEDTAVPSFITSYHEVFAPYSETKFGPLNALITQIRYFAEAITFPRPDLVYAYDWSIYQAATEVADFFKAPLVARMCLSPILLSHQGYTFGLDVTLPAERAIHNAFCEMEIRGLKRAERVIHISSGYMTQYEKFVDFKDKTRLVPNGVNTLSWKNEEGPYQLPGNKGRIKVIFIGRFSEMKGIIPLCKARVPEEIDLIFIGSKEMADSVCLQAINQKIHSEKNVYMLDATYGKEKIRVMKSADAIIVPSYHEPFGTVGLEGLAAGCTVLTSREGGLSDYLVESTSIYCGTESTSIEDAYQKLLHLTPEKKNEIRQAGFEMCEKFSTEESVKKLDAVFSEF
jgi:glycosyltransferase involved in cell wall biosynthesis